MSASVTKYRNLILLSAAALAIFILRTVLAARTDAPRLFEIFDSLTIIGALYTIVRYRRDLRLIDWLSAATFGLVIGLGMRQASLFSPYPFLSVVRSPDCHAVLRGVFTATALLGGLAVMRQGGPVQFHIASGNWKDAGRGLVVGTLVGLPIAVINVFAIQISEASTIDWQPPLTAFLDALQPAVVEEALYRFALWGLLWLILRRLPEKQAVLYSGLVAMLIHNFSHFDDLLVQAPLNALAIGLVMAVIWGLPPVLLARKRGLESAICFHWLQDAARFWAGF